MSEIPYASALAGRNPQQVIAETPVAFARIFASVSDEEAELPTAPGKWSLRQIAAHLADCEIAWSWRLRQAYGQPGVMIQPFDQDTWAPIYSTYSFTDAQATYATLRRWNILFVQALTPEDRAKAVFHPERGEETLWTIVEIMAGHDLHHVALLKALGY